MGRGWVNINIILQVSEGWICRPSDFPQASFFLGVISQERERGRMAETWFWPKDFRLRGEGHGRALLAPLKLLFVFPSSLEWILTSLCCCWASVEDPYWIHNCSQSAGKQGSTGMVLEEAMKERQQDHPLLCKVHACTRTEVVVWGSKMEGKNDLSCQVGEDKSTRKLATFSGFWWLLPTAEGEKKAKRKKGS